MAYRKDKNITREIPPFRKILNYLSPSRNSAVVYFQQTLDITKTKIWLDAYNQRTGRHLHFLHLFITLVGLQLHKNPRLNRYVSGNRFYQRDGVTISVSAKKKIENGGKIVLLKLPIHEDDTFEKVQDRFLQLLGEGRQQEEIYQEKEMSLFTKLPSFILRFALKIILFLDRYHLLPGFFADPDPLFTSLVVANIGSVGLPASYHHLYEYGNCPFFAMIGKTYQSAVVQDAQVVVRDLVDIRYSFDERIEDGLACGFALEGLRKIIEDPAAAGF